MVRVPTTITYSTEYGTIPDETLNAVAYSGEPYDERHLPGLTADGYMFCGWYSTSTFDEGTLVSVGDAIPSHGIIYAKWERITVATTLTNLADEIRVLSGTTEPLGLTEMATNVNDANDEVADQTDLIAQVVSALQGKSVPGGGEDVTAETATYTDLLTDLEAAVDSLPDAGSGGGASIETCSVTINANILRARATTYNNGVFAIAEDMGGESTVTFENVVKGSMVIVVVYGISSPTFTNATQYEQFYMDDLAMNYIYIAIAGE